MTGPNLTMVRVLTDPTGAWRGEGHTITESDASFGTVSMSACSFAALVRVNNELLQDVPTFAAQLDAQLAAALALELDRTGLYGTGVAQPLGIRNTGGVNEETMGTDGAALANYDKILDLIQKIEEANGMAEALIYAPRTKTKLAKLVTGISGDLTKLTAPEAFTALRKTSSNQVSVTETQGSSGAASSIFIGGFQHVVVGIRQGIQIEATRVADDVFAKNQTLVRAIMRADITLGTAWGPGAARGHRAARRHRPAPGGPGGALRQ
jgi:HK97 family phage major capsid protein